MTPGQRRSSCIPFLQLAILLAIDRLGPICGYRVYKVLEEAGLGIAEPAVYTALSKLKARGLLAQVRAREGGRERIRYTLTEEGREELRRLLEEKKELDTVIEKLLAARPSATS